MVYIFLLKPFKTWIFVKIEVTFLAEFFHKQLLFLNGSNKNSAFPKFLLRIVW